MIKTSLTEKWLVVVKELDHEGLTIGVPHEFDSAPHSIRAWRSCVGSNHTSTAVGTVTDPSGNVIVGAAVILVNEETGNLLASHVLANCNSNSKMMM